jgi:hypothetical protein
MKGLAGDGTNPSGELLTKHTQERLGDTRAVELQNRTEFSSKEFGIPKLEACQIVAVSGLRQDDQQRFSE